MENGQNFSRVPRPMVSSGKQKKKWLKPLLIVGGVFLLAGIVFAWKTGSVLNKVSTKGGVLSSIGHMIPGVSDKLAGEDEGSVNVLIMGMRGAEDSSGGLLADSIMVANLNPKDNKIALTSIPRDLYVYDVQNTAERSKINAVYAQGESKRKGQGIADMEKKVSEITGIKISYSMVVNHQGFKDVINSLGGIDIHLDKSFSEPVQFMGTPQRCDGTTYTIPSGKVETKNVKTKNRLGVVKKVTQREYPLCYSKIPSECGGNFTVAAGDSVLNGDQALCFVRSRDTSSDFERAKRQQMVLQLIKAKASSLGTLTDFTKINSLMNSLGNNFQTDMQAWEMKRLYDVYNEISKVNPKLIQHTLENSDEGLLYAPDNIPEAGYILLPRGENYDKIHQLFQNIFNTQSQSDALPKI